MIHKSILREKLMLFFLVLVSLFIFRYSLFVSTVSAHCPLCVAGAAFGITLTRWVGVDDSITGVWVGALLGATSFWAYSWLLTKKLKFFEKYKKGNYTFYNGKEI